MTKIINGNDKIKLNFFDDNQVQKAILNLSEPSKEGDSTVILY